MVGPLALDAGRNHLLLGYGGDGGPLLSDNARGLDLIRLGLDRPIRLPSVLGWLGLLAELSLRRVRWKGGGRPGLRNP